MVGVKYDLCRITTASRTIWFEISQLTPNCNIAIQRQSLARLLLRDLCVSVLDSSLIDSPLSLLRFALSLVEGSIFFFFFSYRFCPFLDVAKSVDMFTHLNNDMLRDIKY